MWRNGTMMAWLAGPAVIMLVPAVAGAQSNIAAGHKRGWGENMGFLNWRDAGSPGGTQGVRIFNSYLAGSIWQENVGWIKTGDGVPGAPGPYGPQYANAVVMGGPDWGVNVDGPTGLLSGLAWGENIGWVNFSGGAMATPPNPARIDYTTNRLRGYAWAPNAGWINLDNATVYVGYTPLCRADADHDGAVTPSDVAAFVNIWFASVNGGTLAGDFDGDGTVAPADIALFVSTWFSALSGGC